LIAFHVVQYVIEICAVLNFGFTLFLNWGQILCFKFGCFGYGTGSTAPGYTPMPFVPPLPKLNVTDIPLNPPLYGNPYF
jgi:hypothetical protein